MTTRESHSSSPTLREYVDLRFNHQDEITKLIKDNSDKATDKAETAQKAVNVASNEWRGTVTDINARTTPRTEFDKLSTDFSAYKLESTQYFASYKMEMQSTIASIVSKQIGEAGIKQGVESTKSDSRATIGAVAAIAGGVAVVATFMLNYLHAPAAVQQPQVVYVQPQQQSQPQQQAPPQQYPPPGTMLVPSTQVPTK